MTQDYLNETETWNNELVPLLKQLAKSEITLLDAKKAERENLTCKNRIALDIARWHRDECKRQYEQKIADAALALLFPGTEGYTP